MQDLEFSSEKELEAWLHEQPHEWVQEIAVRIALRVFPLILSVHSSSEKMLRPELKDDFVLQSFRAMFVSWMARKYPGQDIGRVAVDAASAAVQVNSVAVDAVSGTSASIDTAAIFGTASSAIESVARAAAIAAGYDDAAPMNVATAAVVATIVTGAEVRRALSADARWLMASEKKDRLIDRPLWLEDVRGDQSYATNIPDWAREPLDAFAADETWGGRDPWRLIVHWYHGLLPGGGGEQVRDVFGVEATTKIATQPDGFWTITEGRTAEDILADVQAIREGRPITYREPEGGDAADEAPVKRAELPEDNGSGDGTDDGLPFDRDEPARGTAEQTTSGPDNTTAVTTQFDHPTADDDLGRRPFAQALVKRLDEMLENGGKDGLAVNLHAPWGAGKTSVLLMMEEALTKPERDGGPWAVVTFNAWDYENRNPPWWPLLQAVKDGCVSSLRRLDRSPEANRLEIRWFFWKAVSDWLPALLAILVLMVAVYAFWFAGQDKAAEAAQDATANSNWFVDLIAGSFLKGFATIATVFVTFIAAGRALVFGSSDSAKFYYDLSRDPLKRVKNLFADIISTTELPVCIFIDDLDRCNEDFVVDLLEGIQTSFRHPKVAYVVAADKTWIRAGFESRYETFNADIGDAGQPLGYLFLEKIFQFSVPVPGMGAWKKRYFDKLLKGPEAEEAELSAEAAGSDQTAKVDPAAKSRVFDEKVQQKRADIQERRGRNISREGMRSELRDVSDDAITRAALVLEYADSDLAQKETEHLLARFVDLLPENPRVMKRMINAFGMRLSNDLLEETNVPDEVIARWTILEQRFPALADLLVNRPEWADELASPDESEEVPDAFKPFWKSQPVQDILAGQIRPADGGDQKVDAPPLDADQVRLITRGASD